jgi:hypothetical protein
MNFIDDIQINLNLLLVEFVAKKRGDVTYANTIELIRLNVHPCT